MFSATDLCPESCFRGSFPLPFALLVLIILVVALYFYVKTFRYSYYSLTSIRQLFKHARVKRVLRVIRDRPEYMNNFLLALNSLLFGLGSWICITGLWLELPVLIHHLPESWHLASYLTFAIQLANVAPLIYWFLNRKFPKYCNEVSATNLQLFIGLLGCITLILYWDNTVFVFGSRRSVVLIACAFMLSIVDCLSSVTFLPFMSRFRSVLITPYLIGEGLSGFLPTILAILQDIEDQYNDPRDYNPPEPDLSSLDGHFNATSSLLVNSTDVPLLTTNLTTANNRIANLTAATLNQTTLVGHSHHNYTMNDPEVVAFGPEVFFVSLLVTIVISWLAFFYLQLHQPNHFERRNSLPLPERKRSPRAVLSKYLLGYDAEARKAEEERWEKRKRLICQQEKLNKDVKRIVKQNQHLLKENERVTIVQNNLPTPIDAISTCSFTAIKSSSKPLIKDHQTGNVAVIGSNGAPTNRNRKPAKFNKERLEYYHLQFLMLFACTITFGILPPLQPFSCLPVSHSTLKYATVLSGLSYPVGCSIAIFFKCRSTRMLTLLTLLAACIAAFIFWSATHSPDLPPLFNLSVKTATPNSTLAGFAESLNGTEYDSSFFAEREEDTAMKRFLMHIDRHQSTIISVIMISCWMLFNLTLSYVKTMVTIVLNDKNGSEGLFFLGLFSNLGSVLGAGFMFIVVNHLSWFRSK